MHKNSKSDSYVVREAENIIEKYLNNRLREEWNKLNNDNNNPMFCRYQASFVPL